MSSITKEHEFASVVQQYSCVMLGCLRVAKIAASFLKLISPAYSKTFFAQESHSQIDS
jgi:hypothetical protein